MSDSTYWFLVVYALVAIGFAVVPLGIARLWALYYSPKKSGAEKNASFECGLPAKGDAWVQFKAEYYLYGILFLVFEVETIFLLPFAVAYAGLSFGAVMAMAVFLFLFVEGLAWAWAKGILGKR